MNVTNTQKSVKILLSVNEHEYVGERDSCNFRSGRGEENWKRKQFIQQYAGQFLNDCFHKYGTYKWYNIDEKYHYTYEGQFFANSLEGYGISSCPDGTIFEGLFKDNERFGPGVTTYQDGTQDVGIWNTDYLVRLNQILEENPIPFLAETIKGKAYLLNFKLLVPLQEEKEDAAKRIMKSIGAKEDVLQLSDKLYNEFVRNRNSSFFNNNNYQEYYSTRDKDWTIDVYDPDSDTIKKVIVTHLIAWNNEDLSVSIMKHSFEHRNTENLVSFKVSNTLTGERSLFSEPGLQESSLLELLHACCEDNTSNVVKLISSFDLYPDVSDFLGNNTIIYASVHDQCEILQTLTDFGANVDHLNDESLTALIITILRYTASKFDVISWELAFLPSVEPKYKPEIQEWNTRFKTKAIIDEEQKYLFDLSCKHPVDNKKAKIKPEQQNLRGSKQKGKDNKIPENEDKPDLKLEKLNKIVSTTNCLLNCGAKPDYGECPFPPLILSIFANSPAIIELLLKFGADTNIRTSYHLGSLTPLHITASLAPSSDSIRAATILLANGANPNLKANSIHWKEEVDDILAGTEVEDTGKTPLQLLCMRYDFLDDPENYLGQLSALLINSGGNPNETYLGHNSLTLAIIRGNTKLTKSILETGLIDPNGSLGNNMGVPLTVLILRRYESILPQNICEKIFDLLLDFYANPLNDVPNFCGNTIEFCNEENTSITPKLSSEKDKSKPKKVGKSGKHQQIIDILFEAGETTLINQIRKSAVQILYQYCIECRFEDPIFYQIVKYLTLESASKYLQMLIDHDAIIPTKRFCFELLEFVNTNSAKKQQKQSKNKKLQLSPSEIIHNLVDGIDFDKTFQREKLFQFEVPVPEMDPDVSKYTVCFECLQKTNKILLLCPSCNLVYFCSQDCNIKNHKRKDTKHPCKVPFYDKQFALMQERLARGEPEPLNKFQRFCDLRDELMAEAPNYFAELKKYDRKGASSRELEKDGYDSNEEKRDRKDKNKGGRGKGDKEVKEERKGRKRSREEEGKKSKSGRKGSREGRGKKGKGGRSRSRDTKHKKKKDVKSTSKTTKKGKSTKDGRYKDRDGMFKEKHGRFEEVRDRDRSASGDERKDSKGKIISSPETEDGISSPETEGSLRRRDLDGFATDELRDTLSVICQIYDEKYFSMFMPYCIFVNGQLYYKFINCRGYSAVTYSNI